MTHAFDGFPLSGLLWASTQAARSPRRARGAARSPRGRSPRTPRRRSLASRAARGVWSPRRHGWRAPLPFVSCVTTCSRRAALKNRGRRQNGSECGAIERMPIAEERSEAVEKCPKAFSDSLRILCTLKIGPKSRVAGFRVLQVGYESPEGERDLQTAQAQQAARAKPRVGPRVDGSCPG